MSNKIIDVDKAIEEFNRKNPKKRKLERKDVADALGVTTQVLSDWKRNKTPKIITRIFEIQELTGCSINDFIINKDE